MISQFVRGRVCVCIDAANILYSQQTLGWFISYEQLMRYLRRNTDLGKAIVYTGQFNQDTQQKKFLDMLDINGSMVKTKAVKKIRVAADRFKWKSNLDVELALDMVGMASEYDTAVFMSGDSDFAEPIDRVKAMGKRVIVMSTRGRVEKELLERAKFLDLRKIKAEIIKK